MSYNDTLLYGEGQDLLRISGAPLGVQAVNGVVELILPFDAYRGRKNFVRDETYAAVSRTLQVRAYGDCMLRLTLGSMEAASPMLNPSTMPQAVPLSVEEVDGVYEIFDSTGSLRGRIDGRPIPKKVWSNLLPAREKQFEAEWFPDSKTAVPLKSYDLFAHGKVDSVPLGYAEKSGEVFQTLFSFHADGNECFAGTGERFAKLDLSGRTLDLENTDGRGVNSRRTYKNVPFFLSSRPYGVFIHTSSRVQLSLADISTRSAQGRVEDETLDLFLIGGGGLRDILYNYCTLTGFSPELPLWCYGIWMSRMTYFSADEVREVARRLRDGDYPCDVLHLDTGWFEKDWVCEWKFSSERFPDPAGFMADLREQGYRVSLWQTPDLSEQSDLAPIAQQRGYVPVVNRAQTADSDFSLQPICGSIDFSNPDAVEWYKEELLKPLLKAGVAAIKTDFGECIDMEVEYHSLPAVKLRNRYALLYQKAAFEVTRAHCGDGQALIWARAGWAGCQRYPLHWGGDAACSWDGMAGSLRGGLHLGLSGFTYWSHDVPGFHGVPDFMNSRPSENLYVRWTQFGVFSSHIRYHGTSPREPYEFPAIAGIVRDWWKLRYALIPYIKKQCERSAAAGLPMLRPMILEDEGDPVCWHIDDQYMFGDAFLVAPVMNDDGIRDVYLPAGEWVDFWTGEILSGLRWLRGVCSLLEQMPIFMKRGSRIPVYPRAVPCTDEMDLDKVETVVADKGICGIESFTTC
jgi:alpha-D-xyloside xylohydrolase